MTVLNSAALARAGRKNKPLRQALDRWLAVTEAADWGSVRDVRTTFPSADGVNVVCPKGRMVVATVFNIMGNQYRLITVISYSVRTVVIREALSHGEYDRERWKARLCQ